jgi:cob(I)alamin adenosyltransferase
VSKSDTRIEAYGTVDELNAALGLRARGGLGRWLAAEIDTLQRRPFQAGAELATTDARMFASLERSTDADVTEVEAWIDRLEADLPPLASSCCRAGRASGAAAPGADDLPASERRVVALAGSAAVEPRIVRYPNRVADLLFVMARWSNRRAGVPEEEWHGRR